MEGYHGTVFAYGMTGTGKTFSMQGTQSSPGVIPLAITDIFSYIRETPSREFLLRVSYLEIYNEKIHDLLSMPTGAGAPGAAAQEEKVAGGQPPLAASEAGVVGAADRLAHQAHRSPT